MKWKIDKDLVPVKAHFFFFFAALGPLLPQMNVFGRQLGVSASAMGLVTAVLPLLWAAAKPLFGYAVDYWPNHRKLVFMLLIAFMTGTYCGLWFLPMPEQPDPLVQSVYHLNDTIYLKTNDNTTDAILDKYTCHWNCTTDDKFNAYLSNATYVNTIYIDGPVENASCSLLHMILNDAREGAVTCVPMKDCDLLCYEEALNRSKREIGGSERDGNIVDAFDTVEKGSVKLKITEWSTDGRKSDESNLYTTSSFWAFVVLMCLGTVAFNVANCIGDAVCFDVLGAERSRDYGWQRAWGTAGYGATALLGGWLVDRASGASPLKDFTPAFVLALGATAVDLYSCRRLTLPSLSSPADAGAALWAVLRMPRVLVFITFAVVAGTFDSFIIYYMFWFLEELAEETGSMGQIKLIEGVVVAGQSFCGELLFFFFSGKIIKRWGYGTTITFCLFCYGVRLALVSLIRHPWHLVFIESVMQGPTYALCYASIVGYAAAAAPPGYSATVQGVVAGMDDGVGFALGSLLGGQVYAAAGGRAAFRYFAVAAALAAAAHAVLFRCVSQQTEEKPAAEVTSPEGEKMLPVEMNAIYRETVVPIAEAGKDSEVR